MHTKPNNLLVLRGSLLVCFILLFPIAMSAKPLTIVAYCFMSLCALCFALKPSRAFWRVLMAAFAAMLLTFILPLDLAFVRSGTFKVAWSRVDRAPLREPDLTIGLRARWILEI